MHLDQFRSFRLLFRQFLHNFRAGVVSGVGGVGAARGEVRGAGLAGVVVGVGDEGVLVSGAGSGSIYASFKMR